VDNWKKVTNSRNRVRKKSFGGTFCFSNCHIIAKIPEVSGFNQEDSKTGWVGIPGRPVQ
jgi:hypothetical protein